MAAMSRIISSSAIAEPDRIVLPSSVLISQSRVFVSSFVVTTEGESVVFDILTVEITVELAAEGLRLCGGLSSLAAVDLIDLTEYENEGDNGCKADVLVGVIPVIVLVLVI